MKKLSLALATSLCLVATIPLPASAAQDVAPIEVNDEIPSESTACVRKARSVSYYGTPVTIYASPDQWAEIVFPEMLVGELIEKRSGISVRRPPNFRDRAFFQVDDPTYFGTVFLHGSSGTTYHLRVLARQGCADSTVTVVRYDDESESATADQSSVGTDQGRRSLLEAMIRGDKPLRGYSKEHLEGTMHDRLVFRQGPISFYIKEVWAGRRQSGTILLAENDGRTPYRVAIEAINYQSPEIRRLLGRVREIAMLPTDLRLGPSPEYAADIYNPQHRGLIFIVSEREQNGRR